MEVSTDYKTHEEHRKRSLKLPSHYRTTSKGTAAVDLWHCDDCHVDFVHDWTED